MVLFIVFLLMLLIVFYPVYARGNIYTTSVNTSFDKAKIESSDDLINSLYIKETYMVFMRDGIRLATDVYLPDGGSPPHGSILIRTPYDKNSMNMGDWADIGWPTIV